MLLSRSCMYGIRAALYLAYRGGDHYLPIREISEQLNISFHFLTKILQTLTQHQIMTSFRGPNGGISLARPADTISLKEIVVAIDGRRLFKECGLGLPDCGDDRPCPLHDEWARIRGALDEVLDQTTLADMVRRTREMGLRLEETGKLTTDGEPLRPVQASSPKK